MARYASADEIAQAHHYGVAACLAEQPRVPAVDGNILAMIAGAPVGEPRTLQLLREWRRGYEEQVDAELREITEAGR